jgi:hypothetical protein
MKKKKICKEDRKRNRVVILRVYSVGEQNGQSEREFFFETPF